MAEGKTLLVAQAELNVFRGESFTPPAEQKIVLTTNLPNTSGVAQALTGGGYVDKVITPQTWNSANLGVISNAAMIDWAAATAQWFVQGWQLVCDGDIWYFGHTNEGVYVPPGYNLYFDTQPPKNLQISNNPAGLLPRYSSYEWMNRRLNVLRGAAVTPPGQFKIKLSTTPPNRVTGAITELNVPGYAPAVVGATSVDWSDPASSTSGREIYNLLSIPFPKITSDGLEEIRGYQIVADVVPGEEVWYWGDIAPGMYAFVSDILHILPQGLYVRT